MSEASKSIWARDLDGTGSMHPCIKGDPGAVEFIRADIVVQMAEALRHAIDVANEAREEWDKAPSGMKAGKLLIALSDPDMKYRADITAIHTALSTYAAAVRSKEARG